MQAPIREGPEYRLEKDWGRLEEERYEGGMARWPILG